MEDQSDKRSVCSRPCLERSNSFSTFYLPSERMGEYIPVHYRRVSYLSYDLAYDRYYTESQTLPAAELLARQDRKTAKLFKLIYSFLSLNKSFKTKAKTDLDLDEKRSKLPDYFTEKKKECSEVTVQHERMIEEKKNKKLRYTGGYTDVSSWEGTNTGKDLRMKRWDSLGVLGLVCRLYSERDHSKEDKTGEGEGEASSVKMEADVPEPKCRTIKIEREEDLAHEEAEHLSQHEDSNEDEEEEFLTEDENEYYWD